MAWISYGNSLCLLAPAGAYSAPTCSAGAPSVQSSGTATPSACYSLASATACCPPSPSGMMCRHLMDAPGEGLSMSSAGASPAKTSASPEREQGSTASAAVCGDTSLASLARYNPDTSSWKTRQLSLLAGLGESSVTWPRSGMMRAGECWALPTLALPTNVTVCGSGPKWPTPTKADGTGGPDRRERGGQANLRSAVAWPTPTVHGNHNAPKAGTARGTGLSTAVKTWQTPVADDAVDRKSGKWNSRGEPKLSAQAILDPGHSTQPSSPGPLNPAWVEWLMGWPIGWTDLNVLETDKCRLWQRSHGACLEVDDGR